MLAYWLLFIIPFCGVIFPYRVKAQQSRLFWIIAGLIMSVIMGLRDQVGGDWYNYLPHYNAVSKLSFFKALSFGDPGYYGLNWAVAQIGGDIYLVNFICACILMAGTIVFVRSQPIPWLALVVAVPYMLIVVGMGYTRQSVALGLFLVGLTALRDGRVKTFICWVALAALFHKTAVVMIAFAAVAGTKNRWWTIFWVGVAAILLYLVLLADSSKALVSNYIDAQMDSQGGAIRVTMNALPAVLLLIFRRRLVPDPVERKLWLVFALLALACVPLVSYASTAVDRMALYLIPLQMYVFSRLTRVPSKANARPWIVLAVVGYYAFVQFIWLNYASHAQYWLPYRFMPF
jgi:hypothetical protein